MQLARLRVGVALVSVAFLAGAAQGASLTDGMTKGTPDLKAAGPLAFGPEGVLFIGDPQGAAVFAVATGDTKPMPGGMVKVEGIDAKISAMLGTDTKETKIKDLAVNPASGKAYLSVARGSGPDAASVIIRVAQGGNVEEVPLKNVNFSKVTLPTKTQQITKMAFVKDKLYLAAISNEEFTSTLRAIPFPFKDAKKGTGIEFFHGSHGRLETKSPVRTFVAYDVKGESNLIAAYTCTPLVKIPVSELKPGAKIHAKTVAELGNRNVPLDMIVYQKDGKDYILMANNSRGVMKVSTQNIDKVEPINQKIRDKAGLKYETIASLKGVVHLDKLDKEHAVVLVSNPTGMNLETIALP